MNRLVTLVVAICVTGCVHRRALPSIPAEPFAQQCYALSTDSAPLWRVRLDTTLITSEFAWGRARRVQDLEAEARELPVDFWYATSDSLFVVSNAGRMLVSWYQFAVGPDTLIGHEIWRAYHVGRGVRRATATRIPCIRVPRPNGGW